MKPHIPKISVIVLTHDRPHLLRCSLKSLMTQTDKPDEIIVIDSSVTFQKETRRVIRSLTHVFPIKRTYTRGSIAWSRWFGASIARFPIVLYLDDDCRAKKTYLAKFRTHFARNPHVSAVMGRIINHIPENPYASAQYAYYDKGLHEFFPAMKPAHLTAGRILDCEVMGIRKILMRSLAPSKRHPRYRNDDVEIGVRLISANKLVHFDPTIIAEATPRSSLAAFLDTAFWNGFSDAMTRHRLKISVSEVPYRQHFLPWMGTALRSSPYAQPQKFLFAILLIAFPTVSRVGKMWYHIHMFL